MVQAGLHLRKNVGCAMRTGTGHKTEDARCARPTLRFLRLNRSYGYAFLVQKPAPSILVSPESRCSGTGCDCTTRLTFSAQKVPRPYFCQHHSSLIPAADACVICSGSSCSYRDIPGWEQDLCFFQKGSTGLQPPRLRSFCSS